MSRGKILFTLGLYLQKNIISLLLAAIERSFLTCLWHFLCSVQPIATGKAMHCCPDFLLMLTLLCSVLIFSFIALFLRSLFLVLLFLIQIGQVSFFFY
ncbi:unnamed protein product [Coffea canephora]|uniref:Uncharacterized protein n=1 Tax=Coffea canephora TaxID=49390 RepID=A0A068UWN7_COFCA|nr:unnamed protein product [Coffea canephora]